MIRLFIDLYNFIRLKRSKTVFRIGFFSENNFIYEYLEPYILRKIKQHKILILSFEDIFLDSSRVISPKNDKVRCKLFGDISLISGFNEEKIDWSFLKLVSNSSFFISIAIKDLTKRVLCLKYF